MAKFVDNPYMTRVAGADLTGKKNRIMKLDSSGEMVASSAGTDKHVGVLQTEGVDGENVSFRVANAQGTGKVVLGETVSSYMTELTADSAGKAVGASSGDWVIGFNIDTGVANVAVEYLGANYKKA